MYSYSLLVYHTRVYRVPILSELDLGRWVMPLLRKDCGEPVKERGIWKWLAYEGKEDLKKRKKEVRLVYLIKWMLETKRV